MHDDTTVRETKESNDGQGTAEAARRDLASRYVGTGRQAESLGEWSAAAQLYEWAGALLEGVLEVSPDRLEATAELALVNSRQGDLFAELDGRRAEAGRYFRMALDRFAELSGARPDDLVWRRNLAVLNERLGRLGLETGDLAVARAHYEGSRTIFADLLERDPHTPSRRSDLAAGLGRLGDVEVEASNLASALEHYASSIEMWRGLPRDEAAAAGPIRVVEQKVARIHGRIAELAVEAGRFDEAAKALMVARDIFASLSNAMPDVSVLTVNLALTNYRLGEVLGAAGAPALKRRSHYEACCDTYTDLLVADPSDDATRRDLAVIRQRLGDLGLEAGDMDGARSDYQQSCEIFTALAAAEPGVPERQRDLALGLERRAESVRGDDASTALSRR